MGNKLQPALLGGVVIGVLSALPFVNMGNCCCCAWVIGGGVLAAYLLQQSQSAGISVAEGMFVGLLAGLVGALVGTPLSAILNVAMGSWIDQGALLERILEQAGTLPPEVQQAIEQAKGAGALSAGFGAVAFIASLFMALVINAIFATVGGLIGALMFARKSAEPTPPPIPTM